MGYPACIASSVPTLRGLSVACAKRLYTPNLVSWSDKHKKHGSTWLEIRCDWGCDAGPEHAQDRRRRE